MEVKLRGRQRVGAKENITMFTQLFVKKYDGTVVHSQALPTEMITAAAIKKAVMNESVRLVSASRPAAMIASTGTPFVFSPATSLTPAFSSGPPLSPPLYWVRLPGSVLTGASAGAVCVGGPASSEVAVLYESVLTFSMAQGGRGGFCLHLFFSWICQCDSGLGDGIGWFGVWRWMRLDDIFI
jgi:hypothetical protein